MGQLQPMPAYPAIQPDDVMTAVKDALEALQKAFQAKDAKPQQKQAENANSRQPSRNQASHT